MSNAVMLGSGATTESIAVKRTQYVAKTIPLLFGVPNSRPPSKRTELEDNVTVRGKIGSRKLESTPRIVSSRSAVHSDSVIASITSFASLIFVS